LDLETLLQQKALHDNCNPLGRVKNKREKQSCLDHWDEIRFQIRIVNEPVSACLARVEAIPYYSSSAVSSEASEPLQGSAVGEIFSRTLLLFVLSERSRCCAV